MALVSGLFMQKDPAHPVHGMLPFLFPFASHAFGEKK